jgi:hypothetical protein
MSSKDEIKNLLIEELKTSSQYQECLLLKQVIIAKINEPAITSMNLIYNFTNQQTDEQQQIFKLCFQIEFGWMNDNINNNVVIVDLSKFLI